MKTEVILDDNKVYVRYDRGEWEVHEKTNGWLWLLGSLHEGGKIIVKDKREKIQKHQHKLDAEIN